MDEMHNLVYVMYADDRTDACVCVFACVYACVRIIASCLHAGTTYAGNE